MDPIPNDHHHQHQHRHQPLSKLAIADSLFLGYVCTHRSLAAIHNFREELTRQLHPDHADHADHADHIHHIHHSDHVERTGHTEHTDHADLGLAGLAGSLPAHVPFAISIDNFDDMDGGEFSNDDNEPPLARIGPTLLFELNRYKRQLRRQSTMKIRGSARVERVERVEEVEEGEEVGEVDFDAEERDLSNGGSGHGGSGCVNDSRDGNDISDVSGGGPPVATAIIIVRYFQKRLLGVTCGRLRGVYARTARLALHRHLCGSSSSSPSRPSSAGGRYGQGGHCGQYVPYVERYTFGKNNWRNVYGLGAGDTEVILDVVPLDEIVSDASDGQDGADGATGENEQDGHNEQSIRMKQQQQQQQQQIIIQKLLSELHFEEMVGSQNEPLPRLQNLQADLPIVDIDSKDASNHPILPIYRYPGNYSGTEYPTHPYSHSPTTLSIKTAVETALRPLYTQHMNHCVTNLYRNGGDYIAHHSDKDLDLNREGVILSVSLGSARVLELREREGWRGSDGDVARVDLPPGSMLVLGPETNARFTHSILPVWGEEEEERWRRNISYHEGEGGEGEDAEDGEDDDGEDADGIGSGKHTKHAKRAKCHIEGGGRISLTFRDVRTFLDVKTQRLFGQGVASSFETPILVAEEDGVVDLESLRRAVRRVRGEERRERRRAGWVAAVIGIGSGYVSAMSRLASAGAGVGDGVGDVGARSSNTAKALQREKSQKDQKDVAMALFSGVSIAVVSASASYWYLRCLRNEIRQRREEKEARVFFSKKSASGNKY